MATNCYIAGGMIVDPGDDAEYIISHLTVKPTMIVATHGHFDHIMAAYALQRAYNIPFYIHEDDIFLLGRMQSSAKHFLGLKEVDPPPVPSKIKDLPFIHTPGHTPGSVCLYFKEDNVLFSGDTIFAGGAVGRTDFSYSDKTALTRSVQIILSLPQDTRILPGHGEQTTVREEMVHYNL
jgi:glyoxylase-like metal-dependent hydrolase (beta-lactamase superfamily II)